jgi:aminopeptidase N
MWKTVNKSFTSSFLILIITFLAISEVGATKPPKEKKKKSKLEEMVMDTSNIYPFDPIADYKATPTAYFDLVHTKLELVPNLLEKKLYGKATIDMQPRFFPQTQVVLDAKFMNISKVTLVNRSSKSSETLEYSYDGYKLTVQLKDTVRKNEIIRLHIVYEANPYKMDAATVKVGRGMYFIDPENKNPYKPTHVWTQGETVAASCWFPTFDVNYQKTTEEIYVTVEDKYTTFSNGVLVSSQKNDDGTRTDYWKQSLPHAPYLFVLAFGEYQVYKDKWGKVPVNYYTFPKYFKDVDKVFGKTPAMMEFFSKLLGFDYPWEKYDQIVAYDYTAGAMENTGASVFYEPLFCNQQDLIDRDFEYIIAHELFHQWFGDLVTCESWANLTLNESFANYSEYLWAEHANGVQQADFQWYGAYKGYLKEYYNRKKEPIVNYYYEAPDDLFDNHRYEKGGLVLHMLRKYLGDEAFFTALNEYLSKFAFKSAEIHDLRMVFEKVTGEDLNWFFNQWWMSPGHPILNVTTKYNEVTKSLDVTFIQNQKKVYEEAPIFNLPINIEIYTADSVIVNKVWVNQKKKVFTFFLENAPIAINVDPGKYLLGEINLQQSAEAFAVVFEKTPNLLDKISILDALKDKQAEEAVKNIFIKALKDDFWFVRFHATNLLNAKAYAASTGVNEILVDIINADPSPFVREKAVKKIEASMPDKVAAIAETVLQKDSAYTVLSAALEALFSKSHSKAYTYAQKLKEHENQGMTVSVAKVFADSAQANDYTFFERAMYLQMYRSSTSINNSFEKYLLKTDLATFSKGIQLMKSYIQNEESAGNITNVENTLNAIKTALKDPKTAMKHTDYQAKLQFLETLK